MALAAEPQEWTRRQRRAVELARARGLSGLLVWSTGGGAPYLSADVYYLANFVSPIPQIEDTSHWTGRGHTALVLPADGDPILVIDVPDCPTDAITVADVRESVHVPQTVADVLKAAGLGTADAPVGIVGRQTFLDAHRELIENRLGRPLNSRFTDEILSELRRIKSDYEVALIREATAMGVEYLTRMMNAVEEGKTEGDVVAEGLAYLAGRGVLPPDVAVGSGPTSDQWGRIGSPGWGTARRLRAGDIFHVDAFAPLNHYYTDFGRSTVVGKSPTAAQRDVLEGSINTVDRIVASIKPGARVRDLYASGTRALVEGGFAPHQATAEEAGTSFGQIFPAFGHGLGLAFESPWITEDSGVSLEPNMVLAVEVIVGRPEVGAGYFEQDVLVTPDGHEVLSAGCSARWW